MENCLAMSNPYRQQYQKTAVTTASREKILLMLYEGAIRFNRQARAAMRADKVADKGKFISKTTAILSELMATLDFEASPQIALDLENLYIFMIDKLIEGNINNDEECLTCVDDILNTLYVGWKDVIENPRPDGVPSKELQSDLYEEYVTTQDGTETRANNPKEKNPAVKAQLKTRA